MRFAKLDNEFISEISLSARESHVSLVNPDINIKSAAEMAHLSSSREVRLVRVANGAKSVTVLTELTDNFMSLVIRPKGFRSSMEVPARLRSVRFASAAIGVRSWVGL